MSMYSWRGILLPRRRCWFRGWIPVNGDWTISIEIEHSRLGRNEDVANRCTAALQDNVDERSYCCLNGLYNWFDNPRRNLVWYYIPRVQALSVGLLLFKGKKMRCACSGKRYVRDFSNGCMEKLLVNRVLISGCRISSLGIVAIFAVSFAGSVSWLEKSPTFRRSIH